MPRVTMNLTARDRENAMRIKDKTSARSKAHAVGIALSLTRYVVEKLAMGSELAVRNRDGNLERVIMPELENLGPPERAAE